jgi:dTDP-4-dehydrorhamnose reductase
MKILVLGSSSFISKELKQYFGNKFDYVNRNILDLEDTIAVDAFFKKNKYDIVINTCTKGGVRGKEDEFSVLSANILMFNNLLRNNDKYKYLFNFCSGAAFDRKKNIDQAIEESILEETPEDYYGLSKNLIFRESQKYNNIYTFRIFGCFGKHEIETRFIKNSLNRIKEKKSILIHKDKFMDYISAYDLCMVIEYYIDNLNTVMHKDINLVYNKKYKLSEIAKKILDLKKVNNHVIIEEEGLDKSYTGDGYRLSNLPIKLKGLDQSLKDIIECQI